MVFCAGGILTYLGPPGGLACICIFAVFFSSDGQWLEVRVEFEGALYHVIVRAIAAEDISGRARLTELSAEN